MVSADNRLGLYITVPAYFCLLMACAWWGHRRMVKLENEGTAAAISAHYLGGRQFGWIVTAGTFFASLFSGYTVVGVPVSNDETHCCRIYFFVKLDRH